MKKTVLNTLILATLFFASAANAQVGVGVSTENVHPSAALEVQSETKGFLPPRMTKAERDAIDSPATGLIIYQIDSDTTGLYYYDGSVWKKRVGVQGAKGIQGERGEKGEKGDVGPSGHFSIDAGTSSGELKYWDGKKWVSLLPGNNEQKLTFCEGLPIWTTGGICPGKVTSIDCGNTINNGTLTMLTPASGVSVLLAYTGGIAGFYSGQSVTSTGVTGLTATLQAGNIVSGNGSFTYSITGIPSDTGTASFQINIVGISCTLIVKVNPRIAPNITDIDRNSYKTTYIGNQLWMAENLRTTKYSDGTSIPLVIDQAEWEENYKNNSTLSMMSWYNNDQDNFIANKYGALYNWYAINPTSNANKKVCPTGWHMPSDDEWTVLLDYLQLDGGKLKKEGTTDWKSPNALASNQSGFSALPGGFRDVDGNYYEIYTHGKWWSSTQHESFTVDAYYRDLNYGNGASFRGRYDKRAGFSVRCLKDTGNNEQSIVMCDGVPTFGTAAVCPGKVTSIDCGNAINNHTFTTLSSVNVQLVVFYTGGNGGFYSGQTLTSTGVTGLTATLQSGYFVSGNGSLTYSISGIPSESGTASFQINIGGNTCMFSCDVKSIDFGNSLNNDTLKTLFAVNFVKVIDYKGGNGGFYSGQTLKSTGVSGLTATLQAGNFANGNGSLTYSIKGIPYDTGTATFEINIGGNTHMIKYIVASRISPDITDVDGNVYKTVYIGNQQWMAENLRTTKYNNEASIKLAIDNTEWKAEQYYASPELLMCWYNNEPDNWYGALYNSYLNGETYGQKVCPVGWHIPSNGEWKDLIDFVEGDGYKLKKVGNWFAANDKSGFSALPGGYRKEDGKYGERTNYGLWWSSTPSVNNRYFFILLSGGDGDISLGEISQRAGLSVRCIKD